MRSDRHVKQFEKGAWRTPRNVASRGPAFEGGWMFGAHPALSISPPSLAHLQVTDPIKGYHEDNVAHHAAEDPDRSMRVCEQCATSCSADCSEDVDNRQWNADTECHDQRRKHRHCTGRVSERSNAVGRKN